MHPLSKIKNGETVLNALTIPMFFADLQKATSLDQKKLQTVLAKLLRHAYVEKDVHGLWNAT